MRDKLRSSPKLLALLMGLLTLFFCLYLADHIVGLKNPPARTQAGHAIFWAVLVGLPPLFYRRVKWRNTWLNLPLYFLLYFPIAELCGLKHTHLLLDAPGFISFPRCWNAALVAVVFWGTQSLVYLVLFLFFHTIKQSPPGSPQ